MEHRAGALWSTALAPLWSAALAPLWSTALAPLWSTALAPLWSTDARSLGRSERALDSALLQRHVGASSRQPSRHVP